MKKWTFVSAFISFLNVLFCDRAFGKDWKEKIVFTNEDPVAEGSGCVGQVYKVKVLASAVCPQHDTDQCLDADSFGPFDITPIRSPSSPKLFPHPQEPVYTDAALKVLHPKIDYYINRDLIIMEIGANVLEFLFRDLRWLRLRDCVLAFGMYLWNEVNVTLIILLLSKKPWFVFSKPDPYRK